MNILKYFCRAVTVEQSKVEQSKVEQSKVEQSKVEQSKVEPVETIAITENKIITETDPVPIPIDDMKNIIEDGGIIIEKEITVNTPKLKPASKYTIGKKLSMPYLTPNRYFFIKSRYDENIVLFGKCIEFDKFSRDKVIFRLSESNELNIFDYKLFSFYRAIPKK